MPMRRGFPGRALFADAKAGAVVSGLGLLSMRPRKVVATLSHAFDGLRADGVFNQFTFSLRRPMPRPILDRLGLKATRIRGTLRNLPPASVCRISRCVPRRLPG